MYVVLYFISGLFAANGVPHFIKGITGQQYQTPFGQPSGAFANVVWGSASFVIAWLLWHYVGLHRSLNHTVRYEIAFGVGVFVMALLLASLAGRGLEKNPKAAK